MRSLWIASLVGALSSSALAQTESEYPEEGWASDARFYGAFRTGVAVPPGGRGITPGAGFELGISKPMGFGFGIHLFGMMNPPEVPRFNIPKADFGLGAMADLRFYLPTVDPLTLYATFTAGFLAGPGTLDGVNVVMPAVNPGIGAKVRVADSAFVNFEFGMAGFFIPYINVGVGWEPRRPRRARHVPTQLPPEQSAPPLERTGPPALSPHSERPERVPEEAPAETPVAPDAAAFDPFPARSPPGTTASGDRA